MDIRSKNDMITGINADTSGKVTYKIKAAYSGSYEEQAVEVVDVKKIPYSNDLKNAGVVNPEDACYTVRAGQDKKTNEWGIWLEDQNGTRIENSYVNWAQIGIYSWMGGDYIQEDIVYEYTDTTQTGDTGVTFLFNFRKLPVWIL